MSAFATIARKARKKYRCYHCHGIILPGSRYLRLSGYSDGIYAYKVHEECEAIWADLMKLENYPEEVLDLPGELSECARYKDVLPLIDRYNKHASSVGGTLVRQEVI